MEQDIHVNGIDIHYKQSGEGPPLILLHGNCEEHGIFNALGAKLGAHYTVYALDSRAHGGSGDTGEVSYPLMVADVAAFIEALELKRPFLYGFSDGGIVGLMLAASHPGLLSGLAVSGANTQFSGLKKGWQFLFRLSYFLKRDKRFKMMLDQPPITAGDLRRIEVPTLLLFGEKDMAGREDVALMQANITGAETRILPGENHGSYVINKDTLYPILHGFFG